MYFRQNNVGIYSGLCRFLGEGERKGMLLPTMDQTEGVWIARTNDQGYHFIQEVFPKETEMDQVVIWLYG